MGHRSRAMRWVGGLTQFMLIALCHCRDKARGLKSEEGAGREGGGGGYTHRYTVTTSYNVFIKIQL